MQDARRRGFGIDFGTTNSVVASFDPGTRKTLPFVEGGRPHPSVVWYRSGEDAIVGRSAREKINEYAQVAGNHFETSIKRRLGKDLSIHIHGRERKPYEVAKEIFAFLVRKSMEDYQARVREAVVTVPVYFDGHARRDLRRAADEAGLFVKSFIHEPFAAIVGYHQRQGNLDRLVDLEGKNVLVFDWGGGTLDLTLATVKDGVLFEQGIAGLNDLAGDHFDERLKKVAVAICLDSKGLRPEQVVETRGGKDRLLLNSEKTKIRLSSEQEASLQVAGAFEAGGKPVDLDVSFSRSDFVKIIENDLLDAMAQVDRCLKDAGLTDREVNQVLMIGGSSAIPEIIQRMEARFGTRVEVVRDPDTVIAEGAAVIDGLGLEPVLGRTLAVRLSDDTEFEIFRRGTPCRKALCRKSIEFYCTDPRDGLGKLVLSEAVRNRYRIKGCLSVPVSRTLDKAFNFERVRVDFEMSDDLVLFIHGQGATQAEGASVDLFDLCFGLSLRPARGS